jgi:hypothetical protein
MIKRFLYWLERRSQHKTLAYWHKEVLIARTRVAFCMTALQHYERED